MAAPEAPTEPLSPEVAGRLSEFAKACKAATRIVSMYPPTHPAIQAALARVSEASKQATFNGPFPITVLPDTLLIDPDPTRETRQRNLRLLGRARPGDRTPAPATHPP